MRALGLKEGQVFTYREFAPDIHPSVFIAPTATVIGRVSLSEYASVWFGAVIRGDEVPISIGSHTNIQDNAVIHGDEGGEVIIEDHVTVGHGAIVHGCHIQRGALIGMGAVVLDKAVVEAGALVAAGAVVGPGKRISANTLWAGCPAKPIRELDPSQYSAQDNAKHYRELSDEYRSGNVTLIQQEHRP